MNKRAVRQVEPEEQPTHGKIAICFKTQACLQHARMIIDAKSIGSSCTTHENMNGHRGGSSSLYDA
jgi:hypothetical protein